MGSSFTNVGLCWKRFRLKPEASRSPLQAKNKIFCWAVCPSFWLTCGKITNEWGFLASESRNTSSFHRECFLNSLICVCLGRKKNCYRKSTFCYSVAVVLYMHSFCIFPQRLLLCFSFNCFCFII